MGKVIRFPTERTRQPPRAVPSGIPRSCDGCVKSALTPQGSVFCTLFGEWVINDNADDCEAWEPHG